MLTETERNECAREYRHRGFLITSTSLQSKQSMEPVAYDTTHSAFILTLEGAAEIRFDDKSFLAVPGTVIHGAPGKRLQFRALSQQAFQHLNLYYEAETPWHGLTDWMRSIYSFPLFQNEEKTALLRELVRITKAARWADFMQREYLARCLIGSFFGKDIFNQEDLAVSQTAAYMQEHYAMPLSLSQLAEQCGMSASRYSYRFFKMYASRPIDYLIRLRLSSAAELLYEGCSVTYAAEAVGYQDPLYFSRLFKKHYGYSPSMFHGKREGERENESENTE